MIELYDFTDDKDEAVAGKEFSTYEELLHWLLVDKLGYSVAANKERLDDLDAIASSYHGYSHALQGSDKQVKSALIRILSVLASATVEQVRALEINNEIMSRFLEPEVDEVDNN